MKFMTFTDVHISSVNPQSRVGSYLDDILSKLDQIGRAGKKLGVDFFILAGDLFNLKYPMRNPHSLNKILIDLFNGFGAPVYATEGNHDLRNDSYKTLNEQPLSVMYSSGALVQLRNETVQDGDLRVALRGFPFEENPDLASFPRRPDGVDLSVAVLHLYSSVEGGRYHSSKMFSYKEIAQLGDDVYVMGHLHVDQGVTTIQHEGRQATFVNVGAVSRGSLDDDNISRTPRVCLVELAKNAAGMPTVNATPVRLRVKPASEVFDLESRDKQQKRMEEAEAFVERLRAEDRDQDALERIDSEISSMDLDKAVLDSVTHYLTEADLVLKGEV
jgi:DNA repair exonuclease SbcCD nuclease subunit